jgi:hypothetical protein
MPIPTADLDVDRVVVVALGKVHWLRAAVAPRSPCPCQAHGQPRRTPAHSEVPTAAIMNETLNDIFELRGRAHLTVKRTATRSLYYLNLVLGSTGD